MCIVRARAYYVIRAQADQGSSATEGAYTQEVAGAVQRAARTCKERGVPYGSPQVDASNVEQRIKDGFQFLMACAGRETGALQKGRQLAQR